MRIERRSKAGVLRIYMNGFAPTALAIGAVIIITALAVSTQAWIESSAVPNVPAAVTITTPPLSSSSAPQGTPAQHLHLERITITPTGFEPAEIKRPAGNFLLAVDNRSGLDDVTLHIDVEAGNRVQEQHVSRSKARWRQVVNLEPGSYVLAEAGHPGWVCHVTITAP